MTNDATLFLDLQKVRADLFIAQYALRAAEIELLSEREAHSATRAKLVEAEHTISAIRATAGQDPSIGQPVRTLEVRRRRNY